MNEKIQRRIDNIRFAGKTYRWSKKAVRRREQEYIIAMGGKSRRLAIKSFCSECLGWESPLSQSIRACTDAGCPLFPYRPYQETSEETVEQNEGLKTAV